MKNLESLYRERNSLVNGYISKKMINDQKYYYLQYFSNGQIKSKYIPKSEINDILHQLNRRKEIDREIKQLESSGSKLASLSKNHYELTGNLMSGDEVVASFNCGILTYIDNDKAPLLIKRTQNLSAYLSKRIFDESRQNTRLLKKTMSIKEKDPVMIALLVHGAALTDNYWFKARGSRLHYQDIIFSDIYADTALKGIIYPLRRISRLSPELTLVGSYEKCWKKIDNRWWLYKKENEQEIFSELFSYQIAELLDIPTVKYFFEDGFIKCENFATIYNFEPMSSLCGDDDTYQCAFDILFKLGQSFAIDYLKLMMFDIIVNNVDRHNENYGLLRDKRSGKIVSLAPNFDNNLSLIRIDPDLNNADGFLSVFKKFLLNHPVAYELYKKIHLPILDEEKIRNVLSTIPIIVNEDKLISYILERYYKIINL